MNEIAQNPPAQELPPKRAPIVKAFGIGSAGLNLLEYLQRGGIPADALVAVHSDTVALAGSAAIHKLTVESKAGRRADAPVAENEPAETPQFLLKAKEFCAGADVVFLIAGMGGGVGTAVSPLLARAAREAGAFCLAFATLPFECEGSACAQAAVEGLRLLGTASDLLISLPNQKALALINEATSLMDTFKTCNQLFAGSIQSAWRALQSEVVLGDPFLSLCVSLGRHEGGCIFVTTEVSGPARAKEACEKALAHPLLGGAFDLRQAEALAVSVLGGPGLAMAEVTRVMEQLQRQSGSTPVLMGAGIVPALGDSLLLGLLVVAEGEMSSGAASPEQPVEELPRQLLDETNSAPRRSRFVPPAPELSREKMAQLLKEQGRASGRIRKAAAKLRQTQLPLEIVSKGRFDKSEPTIHKGEDLDVPTYLRRGVALN